MMTTRNDVLARYGMLDRDGSIWMDHGNGVSSRGAYGEAVRRMADRVAELEAAAQSVATPDASEAQTFVCGGSGHLSDAAKAELDDFATYLRLKARFDKQRVSLATPDAQGTPVVCAKCNGMGFTAKYLGNGKDSGGVTMTPCGCGSQTYIVNATPDARRVVEAAKVFVDAQSTMGFGVNGMMKHWYALHDAVRALAATTQGEG